MTEKIIDEIILKKNGDLDWDVHIDGTMSLTDKITLLDVIANMTKQIHESLTKHYLMVRNSINEASRKMSEGEEEEPDAQSMIMILKKLID